MTGNESACDPVGQLAEEFVARYRKGERPALSEYTAKYPELAERIRQVFPLMVLMEEAGTGTEAPQSIPPLAGEAAPETASSMSRRVGGYLILREIGRGAMGVVYEAEQLALGRRVALKVLPLHAAQRGQALERFRREARAAARLHHSNIVPVYEVGEEGEVCYYAMQYIPGQSFDQILEELRRLRADSGGPRSPEPAAPPADGPSPSDKTVIASLLMGRAERFSFARSSSGDGEGQPAEPSPKEPGAGTGGPPSRSPTVLPAGTDRSTTSGRGHYYRSVARVGVQVAEALAYAHSEGVLHRDIKPSNLLLDTDGRVWVADFGLAKTDGDALTQTGVPVGTPLYMAPEQFRGWSDPRSDVYSLGLTLYEAVALRPAFAGANRRDDPPRLRKLDPQVPRDLATIITKAIDMEPGRRYQTAAELAEDLQRFLEDRPIRARQTRTTERAWRWCRRNPAVAMLGIACVMVLVLGFLGMTWQWLRAEKEAARAQANAETARGNAEVANKQRVQAEGNLDRALKAEDEFKEKYWESLFQQAWAQINSGQPGQRRKALEAAREAARLRRSPELRDLAIAALARTDIRPGKQWACCPAGTDFLVFDAELEWYAWADVNGTVSVRRVADDQVLVSLSDPAYKTGVFLRFSADRKYLAVAYGFSPQRYLHVWDLERRDKPVLKRPVHFQGYDFTPDSRQVAVAQADGSIGLYDLATGALVRPLGKGPTPGDLVISPDGTRLAVSRAFGSQVQVRDLATGGLQTTVEQPTREVNDVAWHPHDPNLLATAHWGIYLWDLRAPEQPRAVFPGQAGPTTNIAFSHHGDVLASKGWGDTTVRLWDTWTGRQLVSIYGSAAHGDIPLQFSRDDRRLAFYHNVTQIGLWEVEIAREFRSLASHVKLGDGQYQSLDISPDGRLLVTASRYGPSNGIRLWNLATGRELAYLEVGATHAVRFQPRGDSLFSTHDDGLYHWPIRGGPDALHIGPPRRLGPAGTAGHVSLSRDGRLLAVAHQYRGMVFELADPAPSPVVGLPGWVPWRDLLPPLMNRGERGVVFAHDGVNRVALSPEGRWLAAAMSSGKGVMVFDVKTRKHIKTLPARLYAGAEFSPDGKWLVTGAPDEYGIYEVGTWERRHRLPRSVGGDGPGPVAFSPDGQVLAVVLTGFTVQLINPATARVLATLEPPEPDRNLPGVLRFSPDGSRLAVCTIELRLLHVWDLRLLGQGLTELGLDWDLPAFAAAPASGERKLRKVEVNLGVFPGREHRERSRAHLNAEEWQQALDEANQAIARFANDVEAWRLRAEARLGLKQYDEALADYRHARTLGPPDAQAENRLAWRLVVAPGANKELVAWAVERAKSAVELAPKKGTYWNTLGVAHYRAGNWDEAIEALGKSLDLQRGQEYAYNAFFLAMASWKRGDGATARSWQSKAIGWMDKHDPDNPELRRFHAEAVACARAALGQELEKLTRAVEHNPKDVGAYLRRGHVHRDLGQHEQARDDYSKVLALGPEHVEAYHHRGHAHERLRQFEKARDDFAAALQRRPGDAHFHDRRGLAHYQLKEYEKARADWQRSLDIKPDQAAVCNDLAWLYVTGPEPLRDAKKALPLAERADRLAPNTYSYVNTLGAAYYRLGAYDKAREALSRAAELRKQGPTASNRFFLAMSHHRLGDPAKARACYDQALAWWKAQAKLTESQAEQLSALRAEADALLKDE